MTCQTQSFVCHFRPFLPFSGEILYIGKLFFFIKQNSWTKIWINLRKLTKWVVKWTLAMTPAKIAKWLGSLSHDSVTRPTTTSSTQQVSSSLAWPMGRLLISRADSSAASARRRTTAHPTVVSRVLCTGYVVNKKLSCVLISKIWTQLQ
jgi:hypothetical protein